MNVVTTTQRSFKWVEDVGGLMALLQGDSVPEDASANSLARLPARRLAVHTDIKNSLASTRSSQ